MQGPLLRSTILGVFTWTLLLRIKLDMNLLTVKLLFFLVNRPDVVQGRQVLQEWYQPDQLPVSIITHK